ncbi:MAG: hypothetical protein LIP00_06710 [Parabacteroides sp.]|nr:hypothetical protein [Parabacteroides sp.]
MQTKGKTMKRRLCALVMAFVAACVQTGGHAQDKKGKTWNLKSIPSIRAGIFTGLSRNPASEEVNFVGGLSFRM